MGMLKDADSIDDYIIFRPQYIMSYNKNRNVNRDWYGGAVRYSGSFMTDTSLPVKFYRVKHSDYTNSGFDRGHMVRSDERTATDADNRSTFILSNILPQTPDLNQGVWLNMEYWCETMCKDSLKELYVIAGGIYSATPNTIGNGVAVPDSCWKIVVVLEKGQGWKNVTASTRVEAVIMPNVQGVRNDKWQQYKRSVKDIERVTGYNFLNELNATVQATIEK